MSITFDWSDILQKQIAINRATAKAANEKARAGYLDALGQWSVVAKINVNAGLAVPPVPDKPLMRVIDDANNEHTVAFDPPLPDAVTPVKDPTLPTTVGLRDANTKPQPTIDQKLDAIMAVVSALWERGK